jgi:TetR/AcrR family transcriptional regulator, regulator of cefoperazone and chloramphenicol sensitivity
MFNTSSIKKPGKKEITKAQILAGTIQLLQEQDDPDQVTIRMVAARVNVGIGLINYHFGSRDHLIHEAIGSLMQEQIAPYLNATPVEGADPREMLIGLLKVSTDIALQYQKYSRKMVEYILTHGQMDIPLMVVPLIQQMVGPERTLTEVRLMAFTLITTLQAVLAQSPDFQLFTGLNLFDPKDRSTLICTLVDQIIPSKEKE